MNENETVEAPLVEQPVTAPEERAPMNLAVPPERDSKVRPTSATEVLAPTAEPPDIDPEWLDVEAVRVLLRLRNHGHEAFLVGGCVRDLLLGRHPKDFDMATSARPEEVKKLFSNSRVIGRRFRLVHVFFRGGKIIEVSTFRKNPGVVVEEAAPPEELPSASSDKSVESFDGAEEGDAPQPLDAEAVTPPEAQAPAEDVFITQDNVFGTAVEDALRRDFTINGLFYDPVLGRVIDHVNGLRDLYKHEIRTIGDADIRLREDPVRLLRAVRFAAKLGLDIEPRTYAAMEAAVEDLPRCSAPRLLEETFRLLRGGYASPCLKYVRALDALKLLLPPLDKLLREQGAEEEQLFFDLASAMDTRVLADVPFDDAMLMAVLLLPLGFDGGGLEADSSGQPVRVARVIDDFLKALVQSARLPRRVAERARVILQAQSTLAGLRRRRGGLAGFRRHPLFREALEVFGVWVEATGEYEEALAAWRSGEAPKPSSNAPGPKRRRRRGGRRPGGPSSAPSTPVN